MASSLAQLTPEQQKELEEKLKKMSPEELLEFQMKQCIFCQIISGKIPSKKLYEDEHCLAILDINPAVRGHLLILPKEHYAIMPQVPDKILGQMILATKALSKLLLKALRADGTTVFVANGLVAGQKAQHFMIHLIPRKEDDGIMNVEEHLLDQAQRNKAKIAIGNRLNELLGIKKEIVDTGTSLSKKPSSKPLSKPLSSKEYLSEEFLEEETLDEEALGEKVPEPFLRNSEEKNSEEKSSLSSSGGILTSPSKKLKPEGALTVSKPKNKTNEVPDSGNSKGKGKTPSKKKQKNKVKNNPEPALEEDEQGNSNNDKNDNNSEKDDEGVSLDDIAHLFK